MSHTRNQRDPFERPAGTVFLGAVSDDQEVPVHAEQAADGRQPQTEVERPPLAGQHGDYISAQLTSFRDGVRKNSLQMNQVAAKLNDREIKALGDYIAGLR